MGSYKIFAVLATLCLLKLENPVESIKIAQKQEEPLAWWQERTIYQIYPRSHQDSDGDGVGDLAGIESRLDHFVDIGIGAVWISPFYKSPMKDFGYDISNFTDIEPIFGNMTTFQSLAAAMRARDIKLIIDFVPNHSSDEHEWFKQSLLKVEPYTDYYVWKDAKAYDPDGKPIPPNNWVSVFGGSAWEWREERQQFYLHQFVIGQPDLNYENPAVLNEILAAAVFWMKMGVDGFRLDAVPMIFEEHYDLDEPENPNRPPEAIPEEYRYWEHPYTYDLPGVLDALAEFRRVVDVYSLTDGIERCVMVEAGIPTLEGQFKYYGTDLKPIAHFPFNFEFINRVKAGFNGSDVIAVVDEWFEKMPEGRTANWLVGNHDNNRVSARFGNYAIDPLNMIIHLLPGSSVTYYGEEIGMEDTEISWEDTVDPAGCNAGPDRFQIFSRDPARTPMQWNAEHNAGFSTAEKTWLPMNPNYETLNVQAQSGTSEESHLSIYKAISMLRKSDAWKYGSLETKAPESGAVFGLSRIFNGSGFLVLANFVDFEVTVNVSNLFENIPTSGLVYTRSLGFIPDSIHVGDTISTEAVTVGGKHSLIIQF